MSERTHPSHQKRGLCGDHHEQNLLPGGVPGLHVRASRCGRDRNQSGETAGSVHQQLFRGSCNCEEAVKPGFRGKKLSCA